MDKLRKEFEDWYAKKFEEDNGFPPTRDISELRGKDGEYSGLAYLHGCWIGWKASRESLVIEMPSKISEFNTSTTGYARPEAEHYDEAIDDCREAIHEAGVRTK